MKKEQPCDHVETACTVARTMLAAVEGEIFDPTIVMLMIATRFSQEMASTTGTPALAMQHLAHRLSQQARADMEQEQQ